MKKPTVHGKLSALSMKDRFLSVCPRQVLIMCYLLDLSYDLILIYGSVKSLSLNGICLCLMLSN